MRAIELLAPGQPLIVARAGVLLEVGAVQQLHRDVGGAVERAGAEHPHEVGVANLGGGPRLLDHAGAQLMKSYSIAWSKLHFTGGLALASRGVLPDRVPQSMTVSLTSMLPRVAFE